MDRGFLILLLIAIVLVVGSIWALNNGLLFAPFSAYKNAPTTEKVIEQPVAVKETSRVVISSSRPLPETKVENMPVSPAVSAARSALARRLSLSESVILIVSIQEKEWPDSCLGLAKPEEVCAEVITPGFEVIMQAKGKEYRYRTNSDGRLVRVES